MVRLSLQGPCPVEYGNAFHWGIYLKSHISHRISHYSTTPLLQHSGIHHPVSFQLSPYHHILSGFYLDTQMIVSYTYHIKNVSSINSIYNLETVIMKDEQLLKRIVLNPKVMVGKPVIRGTRLTVDFIRINRGQGYTLDRLRSERILLVELYTQKL